MALRNLFDIYVGASTRSVDLGLPPPPNPVVDGLDSARFFKMCKDGRLFNKTFRANDVDIIYTRNKIKTARKMDFRGFKAALEEIAIKRGESVDTMVSSLVSLTANGPSLSGTVAESNRFHDDRGTYTGVWKSDGDGPIGPTIVDREKMSLSQLCDRKGHNVRGTPLRVAMGPGIFQQSDTPGGRQSFSLEAGINIDLTSSGGGHTSSRRSSDYSVGADDVQAASDSLEALRHVFETYYLASSRSTELPVMLLPPPPNKVLDGMDSAKFFKLCKEAKLFNKTFRANDVDIIFTRNKIKTARKMDWLGFKRAVREVAQKRGDAIEAMVAKILDETANGISLSGTVAESNRFHDDRGTYTGVWKSDGDGPIGPTIVDRDKMNMSQLCDRTKKSDVRGTPLHAMVGPGVHLKAIDTPSSSSSGGGFTDATVFDLVPMASLDDAGRDEEMRENSIAGQPNRPREANQIYPDMRPEIRQIYDHYCALSHFAGKARKVVPTTPGIGAASAGSCEDGVDGSRFLKLCNEARLFGKLFRSTDIDIVFAKYRGLDKKLSFEALLKALLDIACRKNVTFMELLEHVTYTVKEGGGVISGTVAEFNRFHDDKQTWTGTASQGVSSSSSAALPILPLADHSTDLILPVESYQGLKRTYDDYCLLARALKDRSAGAIGPGDGIDSARFLKLCTDSDLFDEAFRLQDIDMIFVKRAKARKLGFEGFLEALKDVCKKKRVNLAGLADTIAQATAGGPSLNGTFAEASRFHDDTSTYTGVKGAH